MRLFIALALALSSACGAAPPPDAPTEADGDAAGWTAEAAEAWSRLDARNAARLASRAMQAGAEDDAREIAARAHLALGQPARAVDALRGVNDPVLLRLRARAQMAADDLEGAIASLEAAAGRADAPEDPWAAAVLPALRAAEAGEPYATSGAETTELPLEELALPVVRVRVDAIETLALVASGADLAVLDPSVRNAPGAIDELTLGALRIHAVPHTVRSLDAVREALGAEIGMVIGADLLLRLSATVDGPGGRLVLHATPPSRPDTTTAPLLRLTGSFLAVPAQIAGHDAWLTLDTAGVFPVLLVPGADETLGLEDAEWQQSEGGPSMTVADVRLGDLHAEGLPLVRGVLDDTHARAVGAPVAGSIGWTVLSQLPITFDANARRLRFE